MASRRVRIIISLGPFGWSDLLTPCPGDLTGQIPRYYVELHNWYRRYLAAAL
jgi:hypothetical protein